MPSTKTSFLMAGFFILLVFLFSILSTIFSFLVIRCITDEMVCLPLPKDMYKSSKSFSFKFSKIVSRYLSNVSLIGRSLRRRAFSKMSAPLARFSSFSRFV